jgi:hypothetical protein
MPRFLILAAIAALQLPCPALAQRHGFVGVGGGASHLSTDRYGVRADTRPSFGVRAGYGGTKVMIVLDYQRHGFGDEQPSPSDWPLGTATPVRVPQILLTEFLLLGAQINLHRGLYVRPALGVARQAYASYGDFDANPGLDSAEVAKEGGPALGASLGYQLKLHPRFSLGIEASVLLTSTVESENGRRAFGIQVAPLLDF